VLNGRMVCASAAPAAVVNMSSNSAGLRTGITVLETEFACPGDDPREHRTAG
jgi:hypothetical protein